MKRIEEVFLLIDISISLRLLKILVARAYEQQHDKSELEKEKFMFILPDLILLHDIIVYLALVQDFDFP